MYPTVADVRGQYSMILSLSMHVFTNATNLFTM